VGRVIAVAINKGGVGKTVTAVSLAAVAARRGWRTLLVDADHQGNAYLSFGGNVDTLTVTLADVLFRGVAPVQACVPLGDGLDLLPAHDDLALVDFEVLTHRERYPAPFRLLREVLAALPPYDLVLIDTPPSLGLMTGNALAAADAVLVPVRAEHFALRGLVKILRAIEDVRARENPRLTLLGILVTMFDARTTLGTEVLQEIRRYYAPRGVRVFETVIPRSIRFAAAPAYHRQPAVWADPHNPLVHAYVQLFEEVLGNGSLLSVPE
jgi:chromosome partitioning protein